MTIRRAGQRIGEARHSNTAKRTVPGVNAAGLQLCSTIGGVRHRLAPRPTPRHYVDTFKDALRRRDPSPASKPLRAIAGRRAAQNRRAAPRRGQRTSGPQHEFAKPAGQHENIGRLSRPSLDDFGNFFRVTQAAEPHSPGLMRGNEEHLRPEPLAK